MKVWSTFITWYFRRNSLPYWCLLALDVLILLASSVLVYWMFHRGYETMIHFRRLMATMLIYLVVSLFTFRLFRTYSGIIRYSSFVDLKRVGYANLLALIIVLIIHYPMFKAPLSVFVHLRAGELIAIYGIST